MAPFLAVEDGRSISADDGSLVLAAGDAAYFVGVLPEIPGTWRIEARASILQMTCDAALVPDRRGPGVAELSADDVPAMLALTDLVYPSYFRPRTHEMGRYLGIWSEGRLAAMAGERMFAAPHREISAVCTHPSFTGRGYAAHLLAHLVASIRERGLEPCLHVSAENTRARDLYLRVGFTVRRPIPLIQVRREV